VGKGAGIPLFARSRLLKKGTDPAGPRGHGVVVLDRPGEPALGGVGLFLAAKKEVLADGPGVLVVGLDPSRSRIVGIIGIAVLGRITVPVIGIGTVIVGIGVVVLARSAVGRKGSLDFFQSGGDAAKTRGGFELLQIPGPFDVVGGRIDSRPMDVIRVGFLVLLLFGGVAAVGFLVLLLFGTLLDPVALDLAQLARVRIRRDAEFFGRRRRRYRCALGRRGGSDGGGSGNVHCIVLYCSVVSCIGLDGRIDGWILGYFLFYCIVLSSATVVVSSLIS